MKKLPVLKLDEMTAERRELRQRINLANRPRFEVELRRLDEVAARLAGNRRERSHFAQDPAGYLRSQALPVSSCELVSARVAQTAEACSVNAVCNANAVANVNAATKVNVALTVLALTLVAAVNVAYVYNKTKFFGVLEEADVSSIFPAGQMLSAPFSAGLL